jgi:hypothetical protein
MQKFTIIMRNLEKLFKVLFKQNFKHTQICSLRRHHIQYTGYFTSDNEVDGIENATHNTFPKISWI